jgi:hypothetical protein
MTLRDEQLGAALRELEVPEHRPEFFSELERRLVAERSRRRRPTPWVRRGLVAVGAAAAAAAVLFFVGLPSDERVPEIAQRQVATAAVVKAKIRAGLARTENLSGVLVSDGPAAGDEERWRFVLTEDGDFRLTGITLVENVAYDASTGVERSLNPSASIGGDTLFAAERRGLAPGLPDQGPSSRWILSRELSAVVRALLAADDPRVREVVHDGRPAWRLTIDIVPNALAGAFAGDRLEVTVDRASGIPVRVTETRAGAFLRELRIERLALDRDLPQDAFALEFPPEAEVMRSDAGFRRVPLAAVAAAVGYAPLVPAWVPAGYELAEVAVAERALPTGVEGGNPPSERVVSLSYRRGFDQFLVTARRTGADPSAWSDPLASGEGIRDAPEPFAVGRGALAGSDAQLLIAPRGIPHVWAVTDELVVTVGGDLTRAELVRVTESLRRQR